MSRSAVISTQIFARSSTAGAGWRVWEAALLVFFLFNSGLSAFTNPAHLLALMTDYL